MKKNLLDYYMIIKTNKQTMPFLNQIINLIDFVKLFYVSNNNLKLRDEPHRIVVICFPKVRYNSSNATK